MGASWVLQTGTRARRPVRHTVFLDDEEVSGTFIPFHSNPPYLELCEFDTGDPFPNDTSVVTKSVAGSNSLFGARRGAFF